MLKIKEKRHRLSEEFYRGRTWVALTLCIKNRFELFKVPEIVDAFLYILDDSANKFNCIIPVYCFMPDHQHMIITGTNDEVDLLKAIINYKQKTGFWMSKNKVGASWQKNFYDHIIRKEEKLATHIRYILDNPVRKGLVSDWQDYPFKGAIGCELDDILVGIV
jgi:REP element-mobilizing transposase RayT